MVTELSGEQKRMLVELGRQYHMHGTQRYMSVRTRYVGPVVYSEGGCFVWKVVQDLYAVSIDWDGIHDLFQPRFYERSRFPLTTEKIT